MRIESPLIFATCLLLPLCARTQVSSFGAKLQVDTVSVASTLPQPSGQRRVSVSFRVFNAGSGIMQPTAVTAQVTFGASTYNLDVPAVAAQASAYVTTSILTNAAQVPIAIQLAPKQIVFHGLAKKPAIVPMAAVQVTIQPGGDFGRWQSIGPIKIAEGSGATGRVTTIAVDPRNPFVVYAGARGSGLWKSSDSSMNWFPVSDSLPTQEIDAVTIDPANPDRVVIATPLGLFQSLNGGSVWTLLTSLNLQTYALDGGALIISRSNGTMYATTPSGVQVSIDHGLHWKIVLGDGTPATSLQVGTTDPTHLFATLTSPVHAVYEATDGGTFPNFWHQLHGCPAAPLPPFPSTANLWVAEAGGHLWLSSVAGAADNHQVSLWRTTAGVCTINGFLEQEWQQVTIPAPCNDYRNQWSYLYADPLNPGSLYKGGIDLCHSTASGDAMTRVANIHGDQHAIAVAPSNPKVVYYGSDGGLARSLDGGATLSFIGLGMANTEFLTIDVDGPSVGVIGGTQDNGTDTWTDTTSSIWGWVPSTGDSSLVAFDRGNSGQFYEISQSTAQIQRRFFGGSNVAVGDSSLPNCCTYVETPDVYESMLSTGGSPAVALTCHGIWSGPPWKLIQPPLGPQPPQQAACDSSNAGDFTRLKFFSAYAQVWVAATNTGHVFYGIYNQPPPADIFHTTAPASPVAVSFVNQSTFYVAMNTQLQGAVYRLQCFASCTSENVTGNLNGEITAMTIDPLSANTVLAAIRNRGVFQGIRSVSGAWTWAPYNDGLPFGVTVTDLEYRKDDSIVAATWGRGAFTLLSRLPGLTNLSARGHITNLTSLRKNPKLPAGPLNPVITTVNLDSRPGFLFTSTSVQGTWLSLLRQAVADNRFVTITYVSSGVNSGTIASVVQK